MTLRFRAPYIGLLVVGLACANEKTPAPGDGVDLTLPGNVTPGMDAGPLADAGSAPTPAVPLPADLVGHWKKQGSITLTTYTFEPDGHYSYVFVYSASPGSCIVLSSVTETEEGTVQAVGDKLNFVPTAATNVEADCYGGRKPKPATFNPWTTGYRVVPGTSPKLELIGSTMTTTFYKD